MNRLVFLENMIIGLLATGFGILTGLLFVKLFFLTWEQVLEIKGWSMYLPYQAVGLTVVAFFSLFLMISFLTVFLIRSNQVIELLRGSRKPKGESKPSLWLCLLAAGCLATAYGLAFAATKDWPVEVLFTIVGLTVVGTYYLFSQLSVFLIRWLKSRRRFYWRGVHLLWLSDLAYWMRDNARMLFLVTIILTSTFVAMGVVLAYNQEIEGQLPPYGFSYYAEPGVKPGKEQLGMIEGELDKRKLEYKKIQALFPYYIVAEKSKGKDVTLNTLDLTQYDSSDPAYDGEEMLMIRLSDYNRFAAADDMERRELKQGEALYLPPPFLRGDTDKWLSGEEESFRFKGKDSGLLVRVIAKEKQSPFIHDLESAAVVVSDADARRLDPAGSKGRYTAYLIPEWKETLSFGVKLVEDSMTQEFEESPASRFFDSHGYAYIMITSRAYDYVSTLMVPRTGLFVGILIAAIFVLCAGSFLYFRLHTDLNQDRMQYRALGRVW